MYRKQILCVHILQSGQFGRGRKKKQKNSKKKGSPSFWLFMAWISTFVLIIYISLPIFLFLIYVSIKVKIIIFLFLFFFLCKSNKGLLLLSFLPISKHIKGSVFFFFSSLTFPFTYYSFFVSLLSIATKESGV